MKTGLTLSDDLTGPGLLPEGVGSLAGEPDHKVILALLLQDKLLPMEWDKLKLSPHNTL